LLMKKPAGAQTDVKGGRYGYCPPCSTKIKYEVRTTAVQFRLLRRDSHFHKPRFLIAVGSVCDLCVLQ
jgi:hypothetical protein